MRKEYFVVKKDGKYHRFILNTHYENEELTNLYLFTKFDVAIETAEQISGNVYELTIIEEKIL